MAQTFEFDKKLAVTIPFRNWLELTRGHLCATLKYPWIRRSRTVRKTRPAKKMVPAYASETELFALAPGPADTQVHTSLEAYLMDWADDHSLLRTPIL